MPEYIDIHAHVNFAAYSADWQDTIKRSLDQNVWMINVGTQKDTSKRAVELSEKYQSGVYAIVGIHPIHTDKTFHDSKELGAGNKEFTSRGEIFDTIIYDSMAIHPKVVGIGECGLDYYRSAPETEKKQRETFSAQIALANKVKKPLMLHVRNSSGKSAYKDALEILKSEAKVFGNFHFFAGSWDEAKKILDLGFFLSFTGVITFTRDYDEIIKNAPLEQIMSETDCPYVTPVPFRGKRNEPSYVQEVVKKIAEIRNEDFEKLRFQMVKNALKLFNLDKIKSI
jgi:TatD DNase family protein